jgi:hypothetical protein
MLNYDPTFTPWLIGFVVLAVVTGLLGLVAIGDAVTGLRRDRLARSQSVRSYYRGLSLSH